MASHAAPTPSTRILIVGGGEFGLSTALSLVKQGLIRPDLITVVDRSATPPSLDAASSDLNKIVRSDYSDSTFSALARKAIGIWKSDPVYAKYYHECGTVILSAKNHPYGAPYVEKALGLNSAETLGLGEKSEGAVGLNSPVEIREAYPYPEGVEKGSFDHDIGYLNPRCGWADARGVMDEVCELVRDAGVNFEAGEVDSLLYESIDGKKDVVGVALKDGRELKADLIILATGSWTGTLLPEMGEQLLATGQVVGTIQLTPEEAESYRGGKNGYGSRVTLAMDTGFYCFPPNRDNVMKLAIHGPGYLNPSSTVVSIPRTTSTPGYEEDQIPREAVAALKAGLTRVHPGLAHKRWASTRLCWYTDTPSSDWLLDYHPDYASLFLATGGSGHAFKFLPVIGSLIVGTIYGTLNESEKKTWGWARLQDFKGDASRGAIEMEGRKLLRKEDMVTKEEL